MRLDSSDLLEMSTCSLICVQDYDLFLVHELAFLSPLPMVGCLTQPWCGGAEGAWSCPKWMWQVLLTPLERPYPFWVWVDGDGLRRWEGKEGELCLVCKMNKKYIKKENTHQKQMAQPLRLIRNRFRRQCIIRIIWYFLYF